MDIIPEILDRLTALEQKTGVAPVAATGTVAPAEGVPAQDPGTAAGNQTPAPTDPAATTAQATARTARRGNTAGDSNAPTA